MGVNLVQVQVLSPALETFTILRKPLPSFVEGLVPVKASNNDTMNPSDNKETGIPPEALADARVVAECVATGRPIPAEVARRIHEEAQKISERLRQEYGMLDIGVPAIRELRGELPE